jgi:hypothetical protein
MNSFFYKVPMWKFPDPASEKLPLPFDLIFHSSPALPRYFAMSVSYPQSPFFSAVNQTSVDFHVSLD